MNISVIIPTNHKHIELLRVINALCEQILRPAEIIIIDSSNEKDSCLEKISSLCEHFNINMIYEYQKFSLPGKARNIGLNIAKSEFIAFIDIKTIPRIQWLKSSLESIINNGADGIWGATYFKADSKFERLVRDGFYGVNHRKTLPGSVFKREIFIKAGQFIDWVRAGEDTEWILRLESLKIPITSSSSALVDYIGLSGASMKILIKKWYRNYSVAKELPQFFPYKIILWLIIYPLFILIAFNWNYLIAGWQMESPFYIGHITKMVSILPVLSYIILRGLILPIKRGVNIFELLPVRFIAIIVVCFIADFIKFLIFTFPKK